MSFNVHHSAGSRNIVWLTPRFIIDALGPFDLDPAAAPAPRPFPTAKMHYEHADGDGLLRPWFGRVWLNPPYGRAMNRWMRRLAEHGQGTGLIFARTDTAAFRSAVWDKATAALFLHGRLTFLRADGTPALNDGGAPSVLVAYGPEDTERLHDSGIEGQFVAIAPTAYLFVTQRLIEDERNVLSAERSWRQVIEEIMRREGRPMSLTELTNMVRNHPKAARNRHLGAKVRQTMQDARFRRTAPSQYELAFPMPKEGRVSPGTALSSR